MKFYALATIGCKVNQYESQQIRALLNRLGWQPVPQDQGYAADLCIVNTCAVTGPASRKSRRAIRKLAGTYPQARIIVVGCYAAVDRSLLAGMPGVWAVVSHHEDILARLAELAGCMVGRSQAVPHPQKGVRASLGGDSYDHTTIKPPQQRFVKDKFGSGNGRGGHASTESAVQESVDAANVTIDGFAGRHRAFVKIQDGCDAGCTYCIIPKLRPTLSSRPPELVESEVRQLVQAGYREVVLCGIFLGAYGRRTARRQRFSQNNGSPLADLIRRLGKIEGLRRLRLSSLEPGDLTDAMLDAMASNPLCVPHLHLPLQSGSDRMLRRMGRQYTTDQYLQVTAKLKEVFDRPAITTDLIVGFPGQQEEDFTQTLQLAEIVGFSKIHAFPYSPRPGTPAAQWRDRPSRDTVRRQMRQLAELERNLAGRFRRQFVGQRVEVLVEGPAGSGRDGWLEGRSDRYFMVEFPGDSRLINEVVEVTILHADADRVEGRLVR